jgi:hypothetical protein
VEADRLISDKTPVVQRQDYVMYLEFFAGMHWFHTDVFNWTPKVKKKYLEDLNLLQYLVSTPLVALIEKDNTKLAKFAKSIGFKMEQPLKLNNGQLGYIYSWSK